MNRVIDKQPQNSSVAGAEADGSGVRLRLFRKQVLERTSSSEHYTIIVAHSRRNWIALAVTAVLITALLGVVVFGDVSKKARVTGIIVSGNGSATVSSPISGALSKMLVSEGQLVKPGDILFEVSADNMTNTGSATDAVKQRIAARRRALFQQAEAIKAESQHHTDEILVKIAGARRTASSLDQKLLNTKQLLLIAQKKIDRVTTLAEQGFYSTVQREEEEEKILSLKSSLNGLMEDREQMLTNIESLKAEAQAATFNSRSLLAQLDQASESLEQESVELDSRSLIRKIAIAPGRVANIAYGVGQYVVAGQSLLAIMPESGSLEVNLFVPSRAIGRIRHGQKVSIRYHAFPYQQFGRRLGKISDIGSTPFAPTELPVSVASTVIGYAQPSRETKSSIPEGLYRIKVTIDKSAEGVPLPLKPGMTLDADIIVGQVKVWQWMFEPFRFSF